MKAILIFGLLFLLTCASKHKKPEVDAHTSSAKNYTIESVTELSQNISKKTATFLVKGILPSPAYSINKIEIEEKDGDVFLTPIIVHDPNKIVIQMAIPFEEKVEIKEIPSKPCNICIDEKVYVENFSLKN